MKEAGIVLIQLIGEQTLPNILPINIIRPALVCNLYTEKTVKQGELVASWAQKKYGARMSVQQEDVQSEDLYESTWQKCRALIEKHRDKRLIMNLTGGTKLMSLAMYKVAEAHGPEVEVVYWDRDTKKLLILKHPESGRVPHWEESANAGLGIIDILEVGFQGGAEISNRDWQAKVVAAKKVQEVADDIKSEVLTLPICSSDRSRKALSRLRKAALKDAALAKSFAEAGCVFTQNGANEQINVQFLTGEWWEVLVADYLERTGRYREVQCSIKTRICEECADMAEVDVLATDGYTLTSYSCKRQLKDPDSEINKHASRSRKLGGISVKCGIAVYKGNDDFFTKLRQLAKAGDMECLAGTDVCNKGNNGAPAPDILAMMGRGASTESFLH